MDVLADTVRCRIVCMRLKKSKKKKVQNEKHNPNLICIMRFNVFNVKILLL